MISIAMTSFNGEKYIIEQLDSIRNQSLPPDELIICDDGSSDNTVSIVKKYIDKYSLIGWKIIENPQNIGYIRNFIKTILLTNGDYIFLADQDDIWKNNKIEYMVKKMKDSSALMLHTEVDIIDNEHKLLRKALNKLPDGLHKVEFKQYMKKSHYCGMSSAMSGRMRDLIQPLSFNTFPTHDWCLGFVASINNGFYTDNRVLSLRRSHGDNVALNMQKGKRSGVLQRIKTIETYQALYKSALEIAKSTGCEEQIQTTIEMFIRINDLREESLYDKSVAKAFSNLRYISWYPSSKAWVSDFMYIIGAF